jgi:hypothetical protein
MLCVNGNLYIYDYRHRETDEIGQTYCPWYKWTNINASCFYESDGKLYFGSNIEGLIYMFGDSQNANDYNDDGEPIQAYWTSKVLGFGKNQLYKAVKKLFFSMKTATRARADVYCSIDGLRWKKVSTTQLDLFDYSNFNYSRFSYITGSFPKVIKKKTKSKRVIYFQIRFENSEINSSMSIVDISMDYDFQSYIK